MTYTHKMYYCKKEELQDMTVKLRLKEMRIKKEITQREMALFLATTETNYRRIENQQINSMSYDNIDKLCKFFDCTPNDLLEFTND